MAALTDDDIAAVQSLSIDNITQLYLRPTNYTKTIQCKLHHATIYELLQVNSQLIARIGTLESSLAETKAANQTQSNLFESRILNLEQQLATSSTSCPPITKKSTTLTNTRTQNQTSNHANSKHSYNNHQKPSTSSNPGGKSTNQSNQPTKHSTSTNDRKQSPKSHNLIIYGLQVPDDNNDKPRLNDLLKTLDIDPNKMLAHRRIPRKEADSSKPPAIKIELDCNDTRKHALKNITKVIADASFPKVYVHPDRSVEQQRRDKDARVARDKLNNALTYTHSSSDGRTFKYGERDDGSKYYWGILNGTCIQKPFLLRD